jgi:glycosyltransferase involved in cell wall biosynthesis
MENGPVIVHVTHETTVKIGGIGAVLKGLFTCKAYLEFAGRSIVTGPLFDRDAPLSKRLGKDGQVLYSSLDGLFNTGYAASFAELEKLYNAPIIYGTKTYIDEQTGVNSTAEIILVDVTAMYDRPVNELKSRLYERFDIKSDQFEHIWEYEQYVRFAAIIIPILSTMGAANEPGIIVGHEWMGMPSVLAAICNDRYDFSTIFYAHEVATIRKIVEEHPGHDVHFYNAMTQGQANGQYLPDVFGCQSGYFKHPLVEASKYCDAICAVGDYTAKELQFLSKDFSDVPIDVVYNGIPTHETSMEDKLRSRRKLQQYCENLLGYRPDYIFTHVTRLVRSKGLWRDLEILEEIDRQFTKRGQSGVFYILSTEVCQRDVEDIANMESAYGWPVAHKQGWPDMSGGETEFYTFVQRFNARSRNIKAVFINQFGFEHKLCGKNMPEDMEPVDIRRGSDVEFGLSVYEPFGISHLEPLTYGGICVLSGVCGCAGFIRKVTGGRTPKNIIIADYVNSDLVKLLNEPIGRSILRRIEQQIGQELAEEILVRLAGSEKDTRVLIEQGYELASEMSWQKIVESFVLPSFRKALSKESRQITAAALPYQTTESL